MQKQESSAMQFDTLSHGVSRERLFALSERSCRRLVRNAAREALVEGEDVPFDLLVRCRHVMIRQDDRRKR